MSGGDGEISGVLRVPSRGQKSLRPGQRKGLEISIQQSGIN